jgi:hypothetical protein
MKALLTLISLLLCGTLFSQTDDCVLKKSDDKILVYTCKAKSGRFKSLKASFTLSNTTVDELVTFLKRVENFPKWQYNMTSAKVLKEVSDSVMIVRSEIDAPWPVENRELIVQYSFDQNEKEKTLKVVTKTTAYDYPSSDEFVRVPFSHAEWNVTTVGTDLHISYSMQIDPGGSLPAWIVNMAMAEGPHHTFFNLKKLLE